MNIVFRADGSSTIGIGHIMRCLTLAEELRGTYQAVFVCRSLVGNMIEHIAGKGFEVYALSCQADIDQIDCWEQDAKNTLEIIRSLKGGVSWLVIDHYQLDEKWQSYVKGSVGAVMVIDDLADRKHNCELLLDQNYYANMSNRYDKLVPSDCIKLLGPSHVLFRDEFRQDLSKQRVRDGFIKRILVFLGGGDADNITAKVMDAIVALTDELPLDDLVIDIVVGSSNAHKSEIETRCNATDNVNYYCQTDKISELIMMSDVCIGAGGTTTWERGALGLPTTTVVCAENQHQTTRDLADVGATRYLGRGSQITVSAIKQELSKLIQSPEILREIGKNMATIMEGSADRLISSSAEYLIANTK